MIRPICLTAAVLVAAGAALPAQDRRDRDFGRSNDAWCRDAGADFCEVREDTLANVTSLDVDARGIGGVHVRGWDGTQARIRARVTTWAPNDAAARDLAREVRITTGNTIVRADGPRRERDRGWSWRDRDREGWAVSYEIQLPRTARLQVDATNGGVIIEDVRGRATNGGISVDFPMTVQGMVNDRRQIRGTIGSGGPPLRVATTNGGVRIMRR